MFKYGEEPKKVFDICVGIFLKTFLKSENVDRNEISFAKIYFFYIFAIFCKLLVPFVNPGTILGIASFTSLKKTIKNYLMFHN